MPGVGGAKDTDGGEGDRLGGVGGDEFGLSLLALFILGVEASVELCFALFDDFWVQRLAQLGEDLVND